jgi:hypothetical protein
MCNCKPKGVVIYEDPNKIILEGYAIELNSSEVFIVRNIENGESDSREITATIEQMGALGYESDTNKEINPIRITIEKLNPSTEAHELCNHTTDEHSQRVHNLLVYLSTLTKIKHNLCIEKAECSIDLDVRIEQTCNAIEQALSIKHTT